MTNMKTVKNEVLKNVKECIEALDDPEIKGLTTEFDNKTIEVTINAMHVMIINLIRAITRKIKDPKIGMELAGFVLAIEALINHLSDQIRELETEDNVGNEEEDE